MSNHNFNQSQMLEQESTSIHDQNYIDYVGETNAYFETEFLLTIDRSSCDYQTEQGKAYQTADTDTIITMHCPKTKHTVAKKISEKTRGSFFNDMYIEVVSVMTLNNVTQKYEISSPGWGIKNEEMGPDFLSMVFMDKKSGTYKSLMIEDYKQLKQNLFNQMFIDSFNDGKFADWIDKSIKNSPKQGNGSFILPITSKNQSQIKDVVFAKNNGYFTIGLTFPLERIYELSNVLYYEGQINKAHNRPNI